MPQCILFALLLALTATAAHAADENMASIKAYTELAAALQCSRLGFPYFIRLMPNRPEVLCIASPVGVERVRVVDVQDVLKEVATQK